MSHSQTKWIAGLTFISVTLLGAGWTFLGTLNDFGIREGGLFTPTAYEILLSYQEFDETDIKELEQLATKDKNNWVKVSQNIKANPQASFQKQMDFLYPIYRGKNAQLPKKIIGKQRNYLDLSYNLSFQINPYCFYHPHQWKEMVSEKEWVDWQIACIQSLIQIGKTYGDVWQDRFTISNEQIEKMREELKRQILDGNLSWYQQLYPFGYKMESNYYAFPYGVPLEWSADSTERKYSDSVLKINLFSQFMMGNKTNTYYATDKLRRVLLRGSIVKKTPDEKAFSWQNGLYTLVFYGYYDQTFFQKLSLKVTKMVKEKKSMKLPTNNHKSTVQSMSDWINNNESHFSRMTDIQEPLPDFKKGSLYLGDSNSYE